MHQTTTLNLGQEVPFSPLGSSNPNSSQNSKVDFILLVEQDGIVVKGENEVFQQQSPSHSFCKTCCRPSLEPTTSLRRKVRQRIPPSNLIETIERRPTSTRRPKRLLIQIFPRELITMQKRIARSKMLVIRRM
jgi:hypothetical protein